MSNHYSPNRKSNLYDKDSIRTFCLSRNVESSFAFLVYCFMEWFAQVLKYFILDSL